METSFVAPLLTRADRINCTLRNGNKTNIQLALEDARY